MWPIQYIPDTVKEAIRKSLLYKIHLRRQFFKPFPETMSIELTNKCNLRCNFCPHSAIQMKKREIDWEVFAKFINDLKELKHVARVIPVGLGEPFLYSHWEEALRYCKHHLPSTPLRLVTNGVAVDEDVAKALCSTLTHHDSILFSLNAWDKKTYEEMMGYDQFDRVVNNILNFLEIRKEGGGDFAAQIQIIKTTRTVSQIKDFRRFWSKHITGSVPIYIRELENWGGKIQTGDSTLKNKMNRYPCLGLWTLVVVDIDGNAYPCCEALADRENSNLLLGNIMDNTISELYSNEKYHRIRNLHLSGNWDSIPECVDCDFWSSAMNVWFTTKKGFK